MCCVRLICDYCSLVMLVCCKLVLRLKCVMFVRCVGSLVSSCFVLVGVS